MYSLMIVEDELLARLALKNSISWDKFNIDEIYEAQNGMEAMEKYEKYRPNILIVDINIPFMNGIELIQKIRKNDKKTKIIILSCLEDFQYAKAAIQASVSQYILKASMSVHEIEEAVSKVLEELKAGQTGEVYRKKYSIEEEYKSKKRLLRRLLLQQTDTEENRQAEAFQMPACLAVFQVNFEIVREQDYSQEFLNKMNFVKSMITTTLQETLPCYVISMPDGMYAVLAECRENKAIKEEFRQLLQNAAKLIEKYTSSYVRTGMGQLMDTQDKIPQEFRAIKRKLSYYSFGGDGLSDRDETMVLKQLDDIWKEIIRKVTAELKETGLEEMEAYVGRIPDFEENYEKRIWDYWSMLINTAAVLYEKKTGCRVDQIAAQYIGKIRTVYTLEDSQKLYSGFLSRINQEYKSKNQYSALVEKAIAFAVKNCSRPVALADAAEELHVSAGYLSTVFSREYGIGYTDFLIQHRIEKAKVLLAAGNERLMDISEKCGFNDQAYFTRTFKKIVGMSPNDYRKSKKEG